MAWGDSWGNRPGQAARDVAKAFYEGRTLNRSSCSTDGETYFVYGDPIARRIKSEDIPRAVEHTLNGGNWGRRELEFRFTYANKQIARHLCGLGIDATYYGRHEGPRVGDKPVDTERWYTKAEFAALKPAPVSVPRTQKPKFVNMTMELFA